MAPMIAAAAKVDGMVKEAKVKVMSCWREFTAQRIKRTAAKDRP